MNKIMNYYSIEAENELNKLMGIKEQLSSCINLNDDGNLINNINEEIKLLNIENNLLSVVQSDFQADSTMAGAIANNDAEFILSADSDLAALLGYKCLSIEKFVFVDRSKNKDIKDIEI